MLCARLSRTLLAGAFVGTLAVGSSTSLEARPLPVTTAAAIAGAAPVDHVQWRAYRGYGGWGGHRWRGGWGGHRWGGYRYHRRGWGGGAVAAGAALGLIGGLALASSAYSYPYYGYDYGYPAYSYYPAYYSYPAYYPSYYYAYPRVRYYRAYYPRRVHWGFRRAHFRHHHWGFRRAHFRHHWGHRGFHRVGFHHRGHWGGRRWR
jgi:hypothetical protein